MQKTPCLPIRQFRYNLDKVERRVRHHCNLSFFLLGTEGLDLFTSRDVRLKVIVQGFGERLGGQGSCNKNASQDNLNNLNRKQAIWSVTYVYVRV